VSTPGIDGLAAARLWAATKFPYLATGVFGAAVIPEPGSGTISVDDSWRMHADPDLAATWTPAELGSVLIHHVCHLLRTHGERAVAAGVGPDDARTWIRAADAEINDDLVPAGLNLPGKPFLPQDLGAVDGLLAEQYFANGSTSRSDIGILGMWRGWAVNSAEFLGFTVLWATFSYPEVPLSPGIPRYRWLLLLEWLVLRPSVTGSRADAINAELRNYVVVHPTDPQGKRPR